MGRMRPRMSKTRYRKPCGRLKDATSCSVFNVLSIWMMISGACSIFCMRFEIYLLSIFDSARSSLIKIQLLCKMFCTHFPDPMQMSCAKYDQVLYDATVVCPFSLTWDRPTATLFGAPIMHRKTRVFGSSGLRNRRAGCALHDPARGKQVHGGTVPRMPFFAAFLPFFSPSKRDRRTRRCVLEGYKARVSVPLDFSLRLL